MRLYECRESQKVNICARPPQQQADILNLCIRYYAHPENPDLRFLTNCWSSDDRVRIETPNGILEGYESIVEYEKAYLTCVHTFKVRQIMFETQLEVLSDSDAVIARNTVVTISPGDAPDFLITRRIDHNYIVATGGGWKFLYRRIEIREDWQ